jgi:hypothetical protein
MDYEHYDGPNKKHYDGDKNGKSQKRCFECNKLSPQAEMTIYYADGTSESMSVNKKKNWELLEDDSHPVHIHATNGATYCKIGSVVKGQENAQHNNKSQDGRQAKKKARQDKAMKQKGARGGHSAESKVKSKIKKEIEQSSEEEIPQSEESEEEETDSSDGEGGVKIKKITQGEQRNDHVMSRAKILCRDCTCHQSRAYENKNARDRQRKDTKKEAEFFLLDFLVSNTKIIILIIYNIIFII